MSVIAITDLQPIGTSLFTDSESFMNELSQEELELRGGGTPSIVASMASLATVASVAVTISASVGFSVGVTIHKAFN